MCALLIWLSWPFISYLGSFSESFWRRRDSLLMTFWLLWAVGFFNFEGDEYFIFFSGLFLLTASTSSSLSFFLGRCSVYAAGATELLKLSNMR